MTELYLMSIHHVFDLFSNNRIRVFLLSVFHETFPLILI